MVDSGDHPLPPRRPTWQSPSNPLSAAPRVDDAAAAIDFYVKAFGATEYGRVPHPDGRLVHAALSINGSMVMLNDDFPSTPTASR